MLTEYALWKPQLVNGAVYQTVKEFTDYVQPNNVVENGEIDANYFQHQPYLDDFNAENNTHLVSVVAVHYEPFGIYSKQHASLDELAEGAVISVLFSEFSAPSFTAMTLAKVCAASEAASSQANASLATFKPAGIA